MPKTISFREYQNGMITALPYWLIKFFPDLSIEKLFLWLPVYLAGLVCVPIILIGNLYRCVPWGFGAACLAGIAHSYYNRTLAGYYDTDIFAITSLHSQSFFFLLHLEPVPSDTLWQLRSPY